VNLSVLLHFSRQLHQRAPPRVAQTQRRRDFAQALRPAGFREMRQDLSIGDRLAGLVVCWHGNGIVCALPAKREGRSAVIRLGAGSANPPIGGLGGALLENAPRGEDTAPSLYFTFTEMALNELWVMKLRPFRSGKPCISWNFSTIRATFPQ